MSAPTAGVHLDGHADELLVGLLTRAVPFHVLLDQERRVLRVGEPLARACPGLVPGRPVEEALRLGGPPGSGWTADAVPTGMVLVYAVDSSLTLRGQLLPAGGGRVLLIGSPWLTSTSQLAEFGLTLADLPAHDPVIDFLLLLQAQSNALADARRLADELRSTAAEQARLAAAERALAAELNALPDLLLRTDRSGRLVEIRPGPDSELPAPVDELLSSSVYLTFPELADQLRPAMERALSGDTVSTFTYLSRQPDRTRHYEARLARTSEDEVLIVVRDVTDRRELEEQLTYQALHDPLTGLANRTLFQDRAAHALASAARDGRSCAVLLIDLDNFKPVNDGLGHAAGDQLLRIVADRLRAVARETDTVARLGGDEFAVLLEAPVESPGDAAVAAERILAELNQPVQLAGTTVELSASLGLAHNTATGSSELDALLRAADSAMYAAKKAGKGRMRTGGRGRS